MLVAKGRAARRTLVRLPRLARHDVVVAGLEPHHAGLRIAHLTDFHCGYMTPSWHVRAAVELANQAAPDLIVMTGDYVSWHREEVRTMERELSGLAAGHVFATLGNHDYYASGREVAAALSRCGYVVLRNEHRTVDFRGAPLHIVGVDDPITRRGNIARAFAGVPERGTRLVLCHCPESVEQVAGRGAHLMFSGHTHGGQINVRGITNRLFARAGRRYYQAGFYEVRGTLLYVNPGIGFSGVRIRAGRGTRAEVSIFRLLPAAY
jgi:predicted MPP superfamily phosphohydrolase